MRLTLTRSINTQTHQRLSPASSISPCAYTMTTAITDDSEVTRLTLYSPDSLQSAAHKLHAVAQRRKVGSPTDETGVKDPSSDMDGCKAAGKSEGHEEEEEEDYEVTYAREQAFAAAFLLPPEVDSDDEDSDADEDGEGGDFGTGSCFVAYRGEEVIGIATYAAYSPQTNNEASDNKVDDLGGMKVAQVQNLYVRPEDEGKGVEDALIGLMVQEAAKDPARWESLYVLAETEGERKVWEGHGWGMMQASGKDGQGWRMLKKL